MYGGVFDPGIDATSQEFFSQVKAGRFHLVVSPVVVDELQDAPESVRQVYEDHLPRPEFISVSVEAARLRDAYLKAGVVTPKWATDALHVCTDRAVVPVSLLSQFVPCRAMSTQ